MKRASIPFSIALLINAACYGLWAWRRARTEGAIMAGALLLFSAVMFIGPPPEAFAWLYIAPVSLMMIGFGVRWESVAGPAARALTALGVAIFLLSLGFAMISDSRGRLTEALIMTIASIAVTLAGLQIKRSELAVLGGIALAFDLLANFLWLAGSATWAWAIIIPSIGIAIIVIFSPKNEARPPSQ
jgi:hypothetical protein